MNLITFVLLTCLALVNINEVLYNRYYCTQLDGLEYFFSQNTVWPGTEGPCGQQQMTAISMESFCWGPRCVYTSIKVTFHIQKHAC